MREIRGKISYKKTELQEILAVIFEMSHVPPSLKRNLLVLAKLFFIKVVMVCWETDLMWLLPTWL